MAWIKQQKLVAPDHAPGGLFAASVDIDGDYAIVGAFQQDADAPGVATTTDAGSAYIFKRIGTSWLASQKLVVPDRATFDLYGVRVAISADHAVVGAFVNDTESAGVNPVVNAGVAYIFQQVGNA